MKNKFFVTILAIMMITLVGCNENNSEQSSSQVASISESSSVVALPEDDTKTAAVYNGEVVTVSKVATVNGKSYLEVDGNPFAYLGAQIRIDAFMNCDFFTYEEIEPLFSEAAKLGVTCVQIPIEWAKIELAQDVFDYTYIDCMLRYAQKYDLKVEFLWFGTNMCGDTHSFTVPDYILKDGKTYPKFDASRTGEYWNYYGILWFLDFDNENLIARETNALNKCMDYIYEWDSTHNGQKRVISMQILNEPDIFIRWRVYQQDVLNSNTGVIFTEEAAWTKIYNSLDALGKTVKNSKYVVVTRVNMATSTGADYNGKANGIYSGSNVNNAPSWAKAIFDLEGIDIIGDDAYNSNIASIKGVSKMYGELLPGNVSHIAENDGNYSNTASLILASASQGAGYLIYDLITSPFFKENNTADIDQGVVEFAENSKSEFTYKAHYEEVQKIINGLKMAGSCLDLVKNSNFAAFNIKSDNKSLSITQDINTTTASINFSTTAAAIGYVMDMEGYLVAYFTETATISITNGEVTAINEGKFVNSQFESINQLTASSTLNCEANKLYKIDFTSSGSLTSTTWNNIG